jgi:hypothetical protein
MKTETTLLMLKLIFNILLIDMIFILEVAGGAAANNVDTSESKPKSADSAMDPGSEARAPAKNSQF